MSLGHLERDVMSCLWAAEQPLTVREVHEALIKQRPVAYTTVMTVLQRLAKKRIALQTRDGKAHLYSAAESREQLAAELMMDALGEVGSNGARETALLHFVERMTPAEAAIFRAALAADSAGEDSPGEDSAGKDSAGKDSAGENAPERTALA